jgi:uncharacterized protein YndB with AHSA1/START domain
MAERQVSVELVIDAPAADIFAIVSDASRHPDIDGSGTVRQARGGPQRLQLGSTFSMDMKLGAPYRMKNTVVEFEQDRRIAWCHFGKHRWRYELEPQGDGRTLVRETFDWSTAIVTKFVELIGAPARNEPGMVKTLERLAALVEGKDGTHG